MIPVWFMDLKFAPNHADTCSEFQIHHTRLIFYPSIGGTPRSPLMPAHQPDNA